MHFSAVDCRLHKKNRVLFGCAGCTLKEDVLFWHYSNFPQNDKVKACAGQKRIYSNAQLLYTRAGKLPRYNHRLSDQITVSYSGCALVYNNFICPLLHVVGIKDTTLLQGLHGQYTYRQHLFPSLWVHMTKIFV